MGYFVAILIIILGFIKGNSKAVTCIQTVYGWALIALNYNSADYWAYEEMYRYCFDPAYSDHEIGYMALCKICSTCGLSYIHFRCIIAFLVVFFTVLGFKALTNNVNMAFSMYLIYGFIGSASGLRNAVAMAILIYASKYLLFNYPKSNVKYFICICAAMLFHYSACFYFLFLLCKIKIKPVILAMFVLSMSVSMLFIWNSGFIYQFITTFTDREKTVQWFAGYDSLYLSPVYIIAFILIFAFLFLLEYKGRLNCNYGYTDKEVTMRVERMVIISSLTFVMAICSTSVWFRILFATMPIGLGVFSYKMPVPYCRSKQIREYNLAMISLYIVLFIFDYGIWSAGNMWAIYNNNYLFSKF